MDLKRAHYQRLLIAAQSIVILLLLALIFQHNTSSIKAQQPFTLVQTDDPIPNIAPGTIGTLHFSLTNNSGKLATFHIDTGTNDYFTISNPGTIAVASGTNVSFVLMVSTTMNIPTGTVYTITVSANDSTSENNFSVFGQFRTVGASPTPVSRSSVCQALPIVIK